MFPKDAIKFLVWHSAANYISIFFVGQSENQMMACFAEIILGHVDGPLRQGNDRNAPRAARRVKGAQSSTLRPPEAIGEHIGLVEKQADMGFGPAFFQENFYRIVARILKRRRMQLVEARLGRGVRTVAQLAQRNGVYYFIVFIVDNYPRQLEILFAQNKQAGGRFPGAGLPNDRSSILISGQAPAAIENRRKRGRRFIALHWRA